MSDKQLTLHRVNNPQDLETIYPTEVAGYPGFYYFLQDNRIAVSRHGAILNLKTGKILKHYFGKNEKVQILFTTPGFKHKAYYVHRIIARAFIGRPSRHLDKEYANLEVNHIDGDRRNNQISNLEWVTGPENIKHAHLSGLFVFDKPVVAMNIKTGLETLFNSTKVCADTFGIHRATFWKHLDSGNSGKFQKDMHVFKYDDETEWPAIDFHNLKTLGESNIRKSVLLEFNESKQKIIFNNLAGAAKYMSFPLTTIWRHVKKYGFFLSKEYKVSLL